MTGGVKKITYSPTDPSSLLGKFSRGTKNKDLRITSTLVQDLEGSDTEYSGLSCAALKHKNKNQLRMNKNITNTLI